MLFKILASSLIMAVVVIPTYADTNAESIKKLQDEVDALQQQVDRLAEIKSDNASKNEAKGFSFNPDISLILNGVYGSLSQDPENYTIPGITLGEESGPGPQGLSLAESELVVSANVDDWFFGRFTAALTPENSIEVEEAFIETLSIPYGFTVKAGRFYSELGYLNTKHPHEWDFYDQPLIYRAFLANQYGDDGIQLRWLAPTNLYLEFGSELYRGESYPAGGAANNGKGTYTVFATTGGDVNVSNSWLAGLSYLSAKADPRLTEEDSLAFVGDTTQLTAYLVWKWAPRGNSYDQNLTIQTAYMKNNEDGVYSTGGPIENNRHGWYAQVVYQFIHGWRAGLRYDWMHIDNPGPAFSGTALDPQNHDPSRYSVMVDYSHSEFSRIRLQYNRDNSGLTAENEIYLQYIMSLGAHGAHRF